ncbi:SH2 domain protein [Ostertagia ostertagi]
MALPLTATELRGSGIQFVFQYLGSVPVTAALHEMTADMRPLVVKECINMVAAEIGLIPPPKPNAIMKPKHEAKSNTADMFGYIAKLRNETDRRCHVPRVMHIIDDAIRLATLDMSPPMAPPIQPTSGIVNIDPTFAQEPKRQPLAPSPRPANRNHIPDRPSPEPGGSCSRDDPNGLLGLDLCDKPWFHGELNRASSEYLLQKDGDFLVRTSANSPGQFILDGMEQGKHRHILLINEGVVRTVNNVFPSVSALIHYHYSNCIPIATQESTVFLLNPILR